MTASMVKYLPIGKGHHFYQTGSKTTKLVDWQIVRVALEQLSHFNSKYIRTIAGGCGDDVRIRPTLITFVFLSRHYNSPCTSISTSLDVSCSSPLNVFLATHVYSRVPSMLSSVTRVAPVSGISFPLTDQVKSGSGRPSAEQLTSSPTYLLIIPSVSSGSGEKLIPPTGSVFVLDKEKRNWIIQSVRDVGFNS